MSEELKHEAELNIGKWLSSALDDENVCAEMKLDIVNWFTYLDTRHPSRNDALDEVLEIVDDLTDRGAIPTTVFVKRLREQLKDK